MKFRAAALASFVVLAHPTNGQNASCPPAPIATKVKVQSTTGAPLTIRELRIFSDAINIAIGKNATQSSDLDGTKDASKAVDGKWRTYSSTGEGCTKWIEVDLVEPHAIDKVLAVNRKCNDDSSCACQLSYSTASLLDSNGNWVDMQATGNTCNKGWVNYQFFKKWKCLTLSPTAAPVTSSPTGSPSASPSASPTPVPHWDQLGQDIESEAAGGRFGWSVSISADGTTVAIGAWGNGSLAGHVRVFKLAVGNNWIQLGQDINGEALGDRFGSSVAISADGTTVAIGAPYNGGSIDGNGHVRVFKLAVGNNWEQLGQDINGEASGDRFGYSVSISADGATVAIGAYGNDDNGSGAGHVRVFKLAVGNNWEQLGQDIDGEASGDSSGRSVSISADGTTVAIGASYNDGNGSMAGHVRVFKLAVGNNWEQLGQDIDGESSYDESGGSVFISADGTTVAIGASYNDGNVYLDDDDCGSNMGHVRVFKLDVGNNWVQLGQDIDGEAISDYSGQSVSISADGTTVAIGAYLNDGQNGRGSGHVRVFKLAVGNNWVQLGQDIDGEASYDYSGRSVSISADGTTVAIGAYGNADRAGHVRVFSIS
eukprot:scaffold2092_cov23-Cyclotella_meneghiniana.AAC.1